MWVYQLCFQIVLTIFVPLSFHINFRKQCLSSLSIEKLLFSPFIYCTLLKFFKCFIYFLRERERERERESMSRGKAERAGRHRIQSSLQVLSYLHRACHGAWTHKWWDHDLSQNRTLNRLSHSGASILYSLEGTHYVLPTLKERRDMLPLLDSGRLTKLVCNSLT